MDIFSTHDMSASEDLNSSHDLKPFFVDPPQSTCGVIDDFSVKDLANGLNEFLQIQDDLESGSSSTPPSDKSDTGNVEEKNIREEPQQCKSTTFEKCLCRGSTFPSSGKMASLTVSIDGEDEITPALLAQSGCTKSVNLPYSGSESLPTPLKPVSAMKGSREKQGIPPKKLSVTWAPDVYDPPHTAVSHAATSNNQRHRSESKKNGKNKKGGSKPSRGSRGKDKKQVRKYGGSSNKCFKSLDAEERLVDCDEPNASLVDLDVSSPDSYCGSSFLKKSVTRLHFSVAEAT